MWRFLPPLVAIASFGCAPDVHIHVYDDDGDDATTGPETTGFNTSGAEGGSNNPDNPDPSNPDASGGSNATNGSDPTTTGATQGTPDPTTEGGDDTTGEPVDMYPQPVDGECPDGLAYNTNDEFEFCTPPCDGDMACPNVVTGDATTVCAFNPDSSLDSCRAAACANKEETCTVGLCMLPATHCVALCNNPATACPDGMECSGDVCRFPVE